MATAEIGQYEDSFVIHFGTEGTRINAYTLASTLVGIADAARAANAIINPGYDIEVVVEALGSGSFKATIRTIYRGAANLFTRDNLKAIVLGVIATAVYEHTLASRPGVVINVGPAEVVIQDGDTRIVVPREVHNATAQVVDTPTFRKALGDTLRAVEEDPSIRTVGFSSSSDESDSPVKLPREQFAAFASEREPIGVETREHVEEAELEILRAILERSRRRWEFAWRGVKISAPILDEDFFARFTAHHITIAPGDALVVKLRIRQQRSPDVGIFINESYEVLEVIRHESRKPGDQLLL